MYVTGGWWWTGPLACLSLFAIRMWIRNIWLRFWCYSGKPGNAFSLSLYLRSNHGSTPSLPNFVTNPLWFLTAYEMMSRPSILAWASDSKNPDLYYFYFHLPHSLILSCMKFHFKMMLHFSLYILNRPEENCTKYILSLNSEQLLYKLFHSVIDQIISH